MENFVIRALNPGYTIDGYSNTGEFIELANLAGTPISLAGYSLTYTNTSGNTISLIIFPDGAVLTGETLLLRYYKSPDATLSHLTYATSIALAAGPLELRYQDTVIDTVCWTGKDNCSAKFDSKHPTSLVRDEIGSFIHVLDYVPNFAADQQALILPAVEIDDANPTNNSPQCRGLEFNEIYSYYDTDSSEQFIELYNATDQDILLDGCALSYKKKTYGLSGTIPADSYLAYYPGTTFSLTKNPSTSNELQLLDADGSLIDELSYPHGQKKSTAYARFYDESGSENWQQTYAPTPGSANQFQQYRTCPAGKVINPLTGNCINETSVVDDACPVGKYRNPLTGRCKSIESSSTDLKPCADGYERNPETNRCRKITSNNDGADFAIVPATGNHSTTTFVAFGVTAAIVLAGLIYIILQFRREIARAFRKIRQRLHHILKDLVARKIGRHRDQEP